jgi:hypothetical protein
MATGTRVDLSRKLNRTWNLQTPDRRPFAAIRRMAALERDKAGVTIRSLPTGVIDLHIVVLAACAVVSLEGVTSAGYVMDSAGG